jgi:hypothetical protein
MRLITLCFFVLFGTIASADPKSDEQDVRTIIGGHFAVDHIGPTEYNAIKQRALARPTVYLGIIERIASTAVPQSLSSLYIPHAIEWIGVNHKAEVKALAAKLLPIYRKARATKDPKADSYRDQRLDQRITELDRLAESRPSIVPTTSVSS